MMYFSMDCTGSQDCSEIDLPSALYTILSSCHRTALPPPPHLPPLSTTWCTVAESRGISFHSTIVMAADIWALKISDAGSVLLCSHRAVVLRKPAVFFGIRGRGLWQACTAVFGVRGRGWWQACTAVFWMRGRGWWQAGTCWTAGPT